MGADAHRARFHSSILDTKMLKAKQKFKELHDSYVILERIIQETKERFEDGSHIIYVNGSYKNDDDPVGKLMRDFRCTSSIDMFYDELKNTVKYFKKTEGERRQMCKAMEALDISEEDKDRLKKRI